MLYVCVEPSSKYGKLSLMISPLVCYPWYNVFMVVSLPCVVVAARGVVCKLTRPRPPPQEALSTFTARFGRNLLDSFCNFLKTPPSKPPFAHAAKACRHRGHCNPQSTQRFTAHWTANAEYQRHFGIVS